MFCETYLFKGYRQTLEDMQKVYKVNVIQQFLDKHENMYETLLTRPHVQTLDRISKMNMIVANYELLANN